MIYKHFLINDLSFDLALVSTAAGRIAALFENNQSLLAGYQIPWKLLEGSYVNCFLSQLIHQPKTILCINTITRIDHTQPLPCNIRIIHVDGQERELYSC